MKNPVWLRQGFFVRNPPALVVRFCLLCAAGVMESGDPITAIAVTVGQCSEARPTRGLVEGYPVSCAAFGIDYQRGQPHKECGL